MLIWIAPGLLGMMAFRRVPGKRPTAHLWSLAVNSAALLLVFLVLRETVGISRESFLAAWLAWTASLLILVGKSAIGIADLRMLVLRFGVGVSIGAAGVTIGMLLFHREHFLQCFNGDGTEFNELARSLRHHFLLWWEIEPANRFGTFVGQS